MSTGQYLMLNAIKTCSKPENLQVKYFTVKINRMNKTQECFILVKSFEIKIVFFFFIFKCL